MYVTVRFEAIVEVSIAVDDEKTTESHKMIVRNAVYEAKELLVSLLRTKRVSLVKETIPISTVVFGDYSREREIESETPKEKE